MRLGRRCEHNGCSARVRVRALFASHYIAMNEHVRVSLVGNSSRKTYLKTTMKWEKIF